MDESEKLDIIDALISLMTGCVIEDLDERMIREGFTIHQELKWVKNRPRAYGGAWGIKRIKSLIKRKHDRLLIRARVVDSFPDDQKMTVSTYFKWCWDD